MRKAINSNEIIKKLKEDLIEVKLHFELIKKEDVEYISVPFKLDYDGGIKTYDILFIPNDELGTLTVLGSKILFINKEVLEYKSFFEILNNINSFTIFGNIFYVENDQETIEVVFSNTELVTNLEGVSKLLDEMLNYIDFISDQIRLEFFEFKEYMVKINNHEK